MKASRSSVGVLPVVPGHLVVLAVGVVVAALGAADLVAAEDHGHAGGQQQRAEQVAPLAGPQRVDRRGRRSGPSTPQFHELLLDSPSLLSSPLASLCLSL